MEITQIKAHLRIKTVLNHYGLEPNRNKMLNCPFHDDKTPSMQVYEKTDTVYCFSGNCRLHGRALDVIDFVMEKENCTKHEAILKAQEMAGLTEMPKTKVETPQMIDYENIFNKLMASMERSEKAKAYLLARKLPFDNVGYNPGTSLKSMKNCVVFPLRNELGKVVSLYGRAIGGAGKHYYSTGRKGLYPGYPKAGTKTIILAESVIDAASIKDYFGDEILAMYGTNGFTKEHETAILQLADLEEVILFFDGDDAGDAAVKKTAERLRKILPKLTISHIVTPRNEDANSLMAKAENPAELLESLLNERVFYGGLAPKEIEESPTPNSELNTTHPHKIIYERDTAIYQIKGGVRTDLDSLKVTIETASKETGRKLRDKIELYQFKQVENYARAANEKLQLRADIVENDLYRLTDLLDDYREALKAKTELPQKKKISVPEGEKAQCLAFLRKPNLLKNINDLIGKSGIIGEEKSRLFLFVIASSHLMRSTLHAVVQGSSGSGKTHIIKKIADLMPQETVKRFTRVTDKSFYNYGETDLKNHLIVLEDYDGMNEEAEFAWRELQSNEVLVSSVSVKDEQTGKIKSGEKKVFGPIASMVATTKGEIYEDNESRIFMLAIDESEVQTERIITFQNELASGKIDQEKQAKIRLFLQNCIRLLARKSVVNPFAGALQMPSKVKQKRRLNELFQSLVKQITLIHQYQRQTDPKGRLISTKEDIENAIEIMFDSIVLKVDELDGMLRNFYEKLKAFIKEKGQKYEFTQREIRQQFRLSKTGCQNYFYNLLELEYITKSNTGRRNTFFYKIAYWDNMAKLRNQIKTELFGQLQTM